MKKIFNLVISLIFLISLSSCGYTPIFSKKDVKFKIEEYSIDGNTNIANRIVKNLKKFERRSKNITSELKEISLSINVQMNKNTAVKDSKGKILTYKLDVAIQANVEDYLLNEIIFNKSFSYNESFKNKDQASATKLLENKAIENIINKVTSDLILTIHQSI